MVSLFETTNEVQMSFLQINKNIFIIKKFVTFYVLRAIGLERSSSLGSLITGFQEQPFYE